MPHIIVKTWPGKSEQQKQRFDAAITKDVMRVLNYGDNAVSVAMEEIDPQTWAEKIYRPDIKQKWNQLYKKPSYDMS